jgi:hypothetical protein
MTDDEIKSMIAAAAGRIADAAAQARLDGATEDQIMDTIRRVATKEVTTLWDQGLLSGPRPPPLEKARGQSSGLS